MGLSTVITAPIHLLYIWFQHLIILFFKPPPPPTKDVLSNTRGRIAVVGAGLTGVSAAAHCIAHGFDVVIFEAGEKTGGIWANVNSTSGLQLNSIMYRFHPALVWSKGFPHRDEILSEINRIWHEYGLESRTRFGTPVKSTKRLEDHKGMPQWEVNDGSDGIFNAIYVCVGTCGSPMWIPFPGIPKDVLPEDVKKKAEEKEKEKQQDNHTDGQQSSTPEDSGDESKKEKQETDDSNDFRKPIIHSSKLDSLNQEAVSGKKVVVIGSGASGVEAVETALNMGAKTCAIIARDDKWIIPRNTFIDTLMAAQPFGREMPLSFLWERFLALYNYWGVEDLVPTDKGLFEGTPVVNSEFLGYVRKGACDYVRGDTIRLTQDGVLVSRRERGTKPGDEGKEEVIDADVVVLATGFHKPQVDFLPEELFPEEKYARPNLYLQTFTTEDWSVCLINCAYMDAIGSVGHFHIGIYTRILLTFLMDAATRPPKEDMKLWVDVIRWIKSHIRFGRTKGHQEFGFFTYMELTIWFMIFHLFNPRRLKWMFFILQGWGVYARPQPKAKAV